MPLIFKAGLIVALAALGGCAFAPKQIVARDPLPPPPAGYAAECSTVYVPVLDHLASCRPVVREPSAVIRARG